MLTKFHRRPNIAAIRRKCTPLLPIRAFGPYPTADCGHPFIISGLRGPARRIDLRTLQSRQLIPAIIALALGMHTRAFAQADTSAIGGPEELTPYEEEMPDAPDASAASAVWTAADSARNIPSYELYGDFDTERIFQRQAEAMKDTSVLCLTTLACDHAMPVCGRVTSPFGARHGRMHYGVDLKLDLGDPVACAFEGMVRISRYHPQFGNVVVVRHPNGLETLYGHLSQRLVQAGDHVEAGQVIGLGGSTGRSTGNHLHFETRYLGQPIDPQMLFDVQEGELKATELHVHPGLFAAVNNARAALHGDVHQVRRGETLYSIARRHDTTVSALCRLNHLSSRAKLRVGQRLRY